MNESSMTLGMDYTRDVNPVGWFASEKLWDIRCYWDGSQLWTRGGNHPKLPESFINQLPRGMHLDGGIECGRDGQEAARLACQFGKIDENKPLLFAVYDAPKARGNWKHRIDAARLLLNGRCKVAYAVECSLVKTVHHLRGMVNGVLSQGGEGIVLRHPQITRYETGRTANFLKIKNPNVL